MSTETKLTNEQIKEALLEIEDFETEDKEVISELDACEKSLHNIELEEQELAKSNKKTLQSFVLTTDKSTKIPSSNQTRQKKADIKRALALSDNADLLITFVPRDKKQVLLEKMIEPYKHAVTKANDTIKEKIEKLLNALIPKRLRTIRATFGRQPFIEHPGFFWICGPKHGNLQIWVKPDIIYYFEQFKEMEYLRQAYPESKLAAIDNLVERYLKATKTLRARRILLSAKLTKVDTYQDLINFNPYLAEELLDEILAEKSLSIHDILVKMKSEKLGKK